MDIQEINDIRKQYAGGNWPQFLNEITIDGLRGWSGQSIRFNFPIVAIAGENGTGKSTVLKAAACAYANTNRKARFYPSVFFVDTMWDAINSGKFSYAAKLGNTSRVYLLKKAVERWRPSANFPERNIVFLDIARTLPRDATAGYVKIAKQAASELSSIELNQKSKELLSYVLGRSYQTARFAKTNIAKSRDIGLLRRENGREVSQFHQGAGESATLDLARALQELPDYSLLIIDEIENSLHPKAQRRLIRSLLTMARQRKLQVILSTHSEYVLEELPPEARIFLQPTTSGITVIPEPSPDLAMSRLDDFRRPEFNIFVEDEEAKILLREILLRSTFREHLETTEILSVGPANVVKMLGKLGNDRTLPFWAIGVVDGDQDRSSGCIPLIGGKSPEKLVFEGLKAKNWEKLDERFGMGAGSLFDILNDAIRDPDHHNWMKNVGDRVQRGGIGVWEIMARQWVELCLSKEEIEIFATEILKHKNHLRR